VTVQYRVAVAKKDERVEGSDDAEVVFSSTLDVVVAPGFDATVEFMRGRVKATGHSGRVLDALRSGEATAAFSRLADAAR
jgi:hypothetical protein